VCSCGLTDVVDEDELGVRLSSSDPHGAHATELTGASLGLGRVMAQGDKVVLLAPVRSS